MGAAAGGLGYFEAVNVRSGRKFLFTSRVGTLFIRAEFSTAVAPMGPPWTIKEGLGDKWA
ncbi:MAG: hypothetical protein WC829_11045 [Hyphomicrobium sp.]|jgi:hypothetical protein